MILPSQLCSIYTEDTIILCDRSVRATLINDDNVELLSRTCASMLGTLRQKCSVICHAVGAVSVVLSFQLSVEFLRRN